MSDYVFEKLSQNMVPFDCVSGTDVEPKPYKHKTHILAVMSSYCAAFLPQGISSIIGSNTSEEEGRKHPTFTCFASFAQHMAPYSVFASRHMLDDMTHVDFNANPGPVQVPGSSMFRQVLPYSILCHKQDDGPVRYFTYQRGKFVPNSEEGIGEKRLEGKVSIGWGGHIEILEAVHTEGVLNTSQTIYNGMMRELVEELRGPDLMFDIDKEITDASIADILLINSDQGQVDTLHLGVTFISRFMTDTPPELASNEAALKDIGWLTLEELRTHDCESWTSQLVDFLEGWESNLQ